MRNQPLKECFSKCVPRPVASASPGHLVEMQILRPLPRPTEETLGMRPSNRVLTSFPGDSDVQWSLKTTDLLCFEQKYHGCCFPFFGTCEIGNWMPETAAAAPEEPDASASVFTRRTHSLAHGCCLTLLTASSGTPVRDRSVKILENLFMVYRNSKMKQMSKKMHNKKACKHHLGSD